MKIYTRKGDKGETSLIGGTRVPKDHLRIEAYGTVDELNSWMGFLSSQPGMEKHSSQLKRVQDLLFTIGSLLAADPDKVQMKLPGLTQADIDQLETEMDQMDAELPELKNFVLPGGSVANAAGHLARCVCRRAERLVVALDRENEVDPLILTFLNRLSDWLFVLSRKINQESGAPEITWAPRGN